MKSKKSGVPDPRKFNQAAVASIVMISLMLLSFGLTWIIPLFITQYKLRNTLLIASWFAVFPLSFSAMILGTIGASRVRMLNQRGLWMAIVGIVAGFLGFFLMAFYIFSSLTF